MISSLRKENGMTQLELAEKMGVTDKAVSKWERDLSCPDINTIPKLAEIFHVSVDQLMQVNTEPKDALRNEPKYTSKDELKGEPNDKPNIESKTEKNEISAMISMIMKAVALAMGVGVTVLSILTELDVNSGMRMLGIGLACLAVTVLSDKDGN